MVIFFFLRRDCFVYFGYELELITVVYVGWWWIMVGAVRVGYVYVVLVCMEIRAWRVRVGVEVFLFRLGFGDFEK